MSYRYSQFDGSITFATSIAQFSLLDQIIRRSYGLLGHVVRLEQSHCSGLDTNKQSDVKLTSNSDMTLAAAGMKRPPDRPRSKWLVQIQFQSDNTQPSAVPSVWVILG